MKEKRGIRELLHKQDGGMHQRPSVEGVQESAKLRKKSILDKKREATKTTERITNAMDTTEDPEELEFLEESRVDANDRVKVFQIEASEVAITEKPVEKLQAWLDIWEDILDASQKEQAKGRSANQETVLDRIKQVAHELYVMEPENIPESWFEQQQEMAQNMGHGHIEVTPEMRSKAAEVIQQDQRGSINTWINYLASADANYPTWVKAWAFSGVMKLRKNTENTVDEQGLRIKGVDQFVPRSKDTVSAFPELNAEALAHIMGLMEKKYGKEYLEILEQKKIVESQLELLKSYEGIQTGITKKQSLLKNPNLPERAKEGIKIQIATDIKKLSKLSADPAERATQTTELQTRLKTLEQSRQHELDVNPEAEGKDIIQIDELLQHTDFRTLYNKAYELLGVGPDEEILKNTRGEWVKYDQGSDPTPLFESLQGHNTGWCTAEQGTAAAQLYGGDFYVYYSESDSGEFSVPRAAIRMKQENGQQQMAEVRGIAVDQNMDPYINPVVREKLPEFPDGEVYLQKVEDSEYLENIYKKHEAGEDLNVENLRFIYEIDRPIQYFGYANNSRIKTIIRHREKTLDYAAIFGCETMDIAKGTKEVHETTQVVMGDVTLEQYLNYINIQHIDGTIVVAEDSVISRELVERLMNEGYIGVVVRYISQLEHYDNTVANRILEYIKKQGQVDLLHDLETYPLAENFAKYISLFKGVDHSHVIDILVLSGQVEAVLMYWGNFDTLYNKKSIIDMALDVGDAETLFDYCRSLKQYHDYIVDELLKRNIYLELLSSEYMFYMDVDHSSVVLQLFERGLMKQVVENLKYYKNLDSQVALLLLKKGYTYEFEEHISSFGNFDVTVLDYLFRRPRLFDVISRHRSKFDDFSEEQEEILKDSGF